MVNKHREMEIGAKSKKSNKYASYFSDFKSWLKAEWLLVLGCMIFIFVLGQNIFKWQHITLFIIVLIVGRIKIGKFFLNMSFQTFLVIISVSLAALSFQKQSELTKMQIDQLNREAKMERIVKTTKWQELKDSILDFFNMQKQFGSVNNFINLPIEEQINFFHRAKEILYSQIKNPVLIEDVKCLTLWRDAINTANVALDFMPIPEIAKNKGISKRYFSDVISDIGQVWVTINPPTENFNNKVY